MLTTTQRSLSSIHGSHRTRVMKYSMKLGPRREKKTCNPRNSATGREDDGGRIKLYTKDTVFAISKLLKYSQWVSAEQQLRALPIKWDSHLINRVLKTHPPMGKSWLFFNWVSQLRGFKHDHFTYTTMIDIFGEAGRISSMFFVFQQMRERGVKIDSVTYTCILHWLSGAGDVEGAVMVWKEMKAVGCPPTVVSYTAYMKILFDNKRIAEAKAVYREMLDLGFTPNCYTYTVLMVHLADSGHYESMVEIFHTMQEARVPPDKAACNILVGKCCESGQIWAVNLILAYMKASLIVLRYPVYLRALELFRQVGETDTLLKLANPHLANPSTPPPASDKPLLRRLFSTKKYAAADRLLLELVGKNTLSDPGLLSETVVLNSAHCRPAAAMVGYRRLVEAGVGVDLTVYLSLVGTLLRTGSWAEAVQTVREMLEAGLPLGVYLGSVVIHRLGSAGRLHSAVEVFSLLRPEEKCSATYTALASACFASGRADEAVEAFETMKRSGVASTGGTFDVMVAGLERAGRTPDARAVREEKRRPAAWSRGGRVGDDVCDLLFNVSAVKPTCINFRGFPAAQSARKKDTGFENRPYPLRAKCSKF